LLGAILAWGGIAPWLLSQGLAELPPGSDGPQFSVLVEWLLSPGVSLMVCATISSLALRLFQQRKTGTVQAGWFRLSRPEPAPAVATWKAVAQALTLGLDSLSVSVRRAILLGGLAGLSLSVLEAVMPADQSRYLPSAGALGLSFVLPASVSIMMASGAILTDFFYSCFKHRIK
jgi:hypothetical protein